MRPDLAGGLRCPACRRDGTLALAAAASDAREVREGALRCRACTASFSVHRGVAELLHDPPAHVVAEATGLERFAGQMRADGWDRASVRRLPEIESGYWYVQSRSMYQLLGSVQLLAGQTIVDVGSNTCWAANRFAERGLRVIALDIATTELQGLYTAEYFIDADDGVFFERVLGSMDAMPLATASVDYVFCCEVLHHNDPAGLRRTFAEAFRVLRPGGRLLMVNETLRTLRDRSGIHTEGVDQFEGYEHAYWAARYRWEATRAGFFTEVTEPHYLAFFGDTDLHLETGTPPWRGAAEGLAFALRASTTARRAYLAWRNHVWGGVSMNMVATKPARFVGRADGMSSAERLARTAAAGVWSTARRRLRRPGVRAPLPRTPWEVQDAQRARAGGAAPATRRHPA
jgi:SAM-dependent methyltransferase